MNEVYVLELTREYSDCIGVFSTKEKAKNVLLTHYADHSSLEYDDEDDYTTKYILNINGKQFFAYITLYKIDEI